MPATTPTRRLRFQQRRRPAGDPLERAAEYLRAGKLVAFPTDTFYGIAADCFCNRAVRSLLRLKGRETPCPLIASGIEQVRAVAVLSGMAERLATSFWPGPLTLVLPARSGRLSEGVVRQGSVAIRVPRHPVARGLAGELGRPVTATSANRTGQPPARSAGEVARSLPAGLALILDAGRSRASLPSTIARVRRGRVEILRLGAVSQRRIERLIDRECGG